MVALLMLCADGDVVASPVTRDLDASPEARLARAQTALDELRLEDAEKELEALVADGSVNEGLRARGWLALGHARASMLDQDGARAAFAAALSIDPTLTLPEGTSPKVAGLFAKTRAALLPPDGPTPTPRTDPAPAPKPAATPKPTPGDAAPDAKPDPLAESRVPEGPAPPPPEASPLVAGIVGGALLAGAGAATVGAFVADATLGNPPEGRTRDEHNQLRLAGVGAVLAAGVLTAGAITAFAIAGSAIMEAP